MIDSQTAKMIQAIASALNTTTAPRGPYAADFVQ